MPNMQPTTGDRQVAHTGDWHRVELVPSSADQTPDTCRAFLRTNLGRASTLRKEIIQSRAGQNAIALFSWQDLPMRWEADRWVLDLPLNEVGFFEYKAYLTDAQGTQQWPDGPNGGIAVHPNATRSGNTIYCAWIRLFGEHRHQSETRSQRERPELASLDADGYAVIPPSGKIRELIEQLPHIVDTLGCRIIHLLPINPTPTTYARFGRFGSPYAAQNLEAVDPALVEFDQRTTAIDQFLELTRAIHARSARVIIDLVANHTGWGSNLHENHPEWYARQEDGTFISPGAWGNIWGDLVELKHDQPETWDYLAGVFLTWCERGVDGFRCDAGYMVPLTAWQYIIARVRESFPDTLFLLEGLGGAWEATERLLTEGGMQWAYSELFQEYQAPSVQAYLQHCIHQSPRVGTLVHYSETHDNPRLAAQGKTWSLLRNQLCALTSTQGAFGFTCGVEWLATEKIIVHECTGLNWGAQENIVHAMARLGRLLNHHPCFFDGATLRLSPQPTSRTCLLQRVSREGDRALWILINTDVTQSQQVTLETSQFPNLSQAPAFDWMQGGSLVPWTEGERSWSLELAPGQVCCLEEAASANQHDGREGQRYRDARARAAMGLACLSQIHGIEHTPRVDWKELERSLDTDLEAWLSGLSEKDKEASPPRSTSAWPRVTCWSSSDRPRMLVVPMGHWIVIREHHPFRLTLKADSGRSITRLDSVPAGGDHVATLLATKPGKISMHLDLFGRETACTATTWLVCDHRQAAFLSGSDRMALLTNGRGAMARVHADPGHIQSKYDCLLGANLHPNLPVDRHVLIKRMRLWANADGFITPLNQAALIDFSATAPAKWRFYIPAGAGRSLELEMMLHLMEGCNTLIGRFQRVEKNQRLSEGEEFPADGGLQLTLRLDLEDRNFHQQTQRSDGADAHFHTHCQPLDSGDGFLFQPAGDRRLRVNVDRGHFHPEPEWSQGIAHPIEQTRGQEGSGDAWSPGWFALPMSSGEVIHLTATCENQAPSEAAMHAALNQPEKDIQRAKSSELQSHCDAWGDHLTTALRAYVVQRDAGKTVIAGYPWFLDWGRDSIIVARGMLHAGMEEEVVALLKIFGRFESDGTLPNTIHGSDASNRDTSDAPLWYGVLLEETAGQVGDALYHAPVSEGGPLLGEILFRIARGILKGTPNGIHMDAASGLVWSPSHFTWMDTNYPAGTPREGYPIEIQALWIRLLEQLHQLDSSQSGSSSSKGSESAIDTRCPDGNWGQWAKKARDHVERLFWIEDKQWPADLLIAPSGTPAGEALQDQALRSNALWAVTLGCLQGERAQATVRAAQRHLVVPGALRSLAPLPTIPPLPIHGHHGGLLNDPSNPYWGRYEGDEDQRRKPAYHNGTAWLWTFPSFCEAMVMAWPSDPAAHTAALDYLSSMQAHWKEGCSGQLPEILDGDAPHTQRGCDAQAWSVSEALRVWRWLHANPPHQP